MRAYQRDLMICLIALLIAGGVVWHFFGNLAKSREAEEVDLYAALAPEAECLLIANRPSTIRLLVETEPAFGKILSSYIPLYIYRMMEETPTSPLLLSFHQEGVVLYTKANKREAYRLDRSILRPLFGGYAPQRQEEGEMHYAFYPDTANRFFGVYQAGNIWVGSYSKRLLEISAHRLKECSERKRPDEAVETLARSLSEKVPIHLVVPIDSLGLDRKGWMTADLYIGKGKEVCCIGQLPFEPHEATDSLCLVMAERLASNLMQRFPLLDTLRCTPDREVGSVYFSVCTSGISTVNRSYE